METESLTAGPAASSAVTTASAASPASPDPSLDLTSLDTPEGLVRAVAQAMRTEDATAYVALTVSTAADFDAMFAVGGAASRTPSAEELARQRDKRAAAFRSFIAKLRDRGVEIRTITPAAIDVSQVLRKGSMGFAEDLSFAVRTTGGEEIRVTIDDCLLAPRGWIVVDGLKLREPK